MRGQTVNNLPKHCLLWCSLVPAGHGTEAEGGDEVGLVCKRLPFFWGGAFPLMICTFFQFDQFFSLCVELAVLFAADGVYIIDVVQFGELNDLLVAVFVFLAAQIVVELESQKQFNAIYSIIGG